MDSSPNTVACIQARMGSSRLPGKVMLPLDEFHVLEHDIRRVDSADLIDEVVVATTEKKQDDIIARYATRAGALVHRGSENDVLGRMYEAASAFDADIVVRATADNPLVSPMSIDKSIQLANDGGYDIVSPHVERTFPRGVAVETFTFESFRDVKANSDQSHQREHVTPYYYENPDDFNLRNLTSNEVFSEEALHDRTELRLTLDEADDYELFRRLYEEIVYEETLDLSEAIQYIDEKELAAINRHVEQKNT